MYVSPPVSADESFNLAKAESTSTLEASSKLGSLEHSIAPATLPKEEGSG
jgi:hypothetical protein